MPFRPRRFALLALLAAAALVAGTGCPPPPPGPDGGTDAGADAGPDSGQPDAAVSRCTPLGPPTAQSPDAGPAPLFTAEARITAPSIAQPGADGVAMDVDRDGGADVVVLAWNFQNASDPGAVAVWLNDGTGHFTDATAARVAPGTQLQFIRKPVVLDADGDGRPDLFIAEDSVAPGGAFSNLLLQGVDGKLADVSATKLSPHERAVTHSASAADVDCDGRQDLYASAVDGTGPHLYVGSGAGSFTARAAALPPAIANLTQRYWGAAFCDVNRDGAPDLALGTGWGSPTDSVLLMNDGFGNLTTQVPLPASFFPVGHVNHSDLECVDVDLDGWPDLVAASYDDSTAPHLALWHNDGTGHFTDVTAANLPQTWPASLDVRRVSVADFNGDGWPDLYVYAPCQSRLYLNQGGGRFAEDLTTIPASHRCALLLPMDADGDGWTDLVPVSSGSPMAVLMNRTRHPVPVLRSVIPPRAVAGADPFALSVAADGLVAGATVQLDGVTRATTVNPLGTARVSLTAADLAGPGAHAVTVTNPPPGGGPSAALTFNVYPPGLTHLRMAEPGLYTQFEDRGAFGGFNPGDLLHNWDATSASGLLVKDEVALQLDAIHGMGVSTLTMELRSASPTGEFQFPTCNLGPWLGPQYPQPTSQELTNLVRLLDLLQAKGVKLNLRLVNTNMGESPPTNNTTWLTALINAVKDHPALSLLIFDGTTRTVDTNGDGTPDVCGIPAEAPLWLGPDSAVGQYVQFAIGLGRTLGVPTSKLSAEAVSGNYNTDSEQGGPGGLWSPVRSLQVILDRLAVPEAQRAYALSMYWQPRCYQAGGLPCSPLSGDAWMEETLVHVYSVTGTSARVVVAEFGAVDGQVAPTQAAVEQMAALFDRFGVAGGALWRWTSYDTGEDSNASLAQPVKRRGAAFTYNPVQKELVDYAGVHLGLVPNGSFERDQDLDGLPDLWTFTDAGTAQRLDLADAGVPAARGRWALRLATPPGASGTLAASSAPIAVSAATTYTTTARLRFAWTGDPDPSADAGARPQVDLVVRYLDGAGAPSFERQSDTFAFFQEDATAGFATFPLQFTTPLDAASVVLDVQVQPHALPGSLVLDADDLH